MIYIVTGNTELFQHEDPDIRFASVEECLFYLETIKYIGLDTETEGFDPHTKRILSLQLGDYNNQYVIDTSTIDIVKFKSLIEDKSKVFLMQNAKFDLKFLYKHDIVCENVWDTYLAECVLTTGIQSARKSLDFLANKYCGVQLDKSIRGNIHKEGLSTRVVKYGADDVKYLESIKNEQDKLLDKYDLQIALSLDNLFVKVLAYTEFCGIYLDRTAWSNKMKEDRAKMLKAKSKLNEWIINNNHKEWIDPQGDLFNPGVNVTINWNSPEQVVKLLHKYDVNTKVVDEETGKLKDSCEAKVLKSQKEKTSLIPLLLKYKEHEKEVSTYGEKFIKFINPVTNRLHGEYHQLKSTGRMGSGGGESKINFQNIPADKRVRHCFTAEESNVLINADFSGQEQIVFANWCKDPDILEFYYKKLGDMHSYIASKIYPELRDSPLDEIKAKHKSKRQNAKSAGFAINYGGNGNTIAENLNITVEEGTEIYEAYFEAFKGIKDYFERVSLEAIKNGYVTFNSISKRKSFIPFYEDFKRVQQHITPDFWNNYRFYKENDTNIFESRYKPICREYFKKKGNIERKALNYPIQGSSAEITKLAGIYIFKQLINRNLLFKVKICNIVHDEYILEAPESLGKEVADIVETSMCKAGDVFCKTIPLEAEAVVSNYWEH